MAKFIAEFSNGGELQTITQEADSAQTLLTQLWETFGMGIHITNITEVEDDSNSSSGENAD